MWHDQCNWAQYNTSISDNNKISLLPLGKLFPESRTSHGRCVSQTTNTRWRQVTRCVAHGIAVLSRVRGEFQSTSLALHRVRGGTNQRIHTVQSARKTHTRVRTAPSARILDLQMEIDKLEFLAEFTKRTRREITKRTTQYVKYDWMRKDAAIFLIG